MARKKNEESNSVERIPVEKVDVGGVYKNAVQELVKVEEINEKNERVVLYNINGAHRQWVYFKHLYLTEKLYQSR